MMDEQTPQPQSGDQPPAPSGSATPTPGPRPVLAVSPAGADPSLPTTTATTPSAMSTSSDTPAATTGTTSSFSSSRPAYTPQFTAATQMILSRMRGELSSLSGALSAASAAGSMMPRITSEAYEDVRRRLVMSMNTTTTQMTMRMPPAPPPVVRMPSAPAPAPTALPTRPHGKPSGSTTKKTTSPDTAKNGGPPKITIKILSSENKVKKSKAASATTSAGGSSAGNGPGRPSKRGRRTKREDDTSSLSSLSDVSEPEAGTNENDSSSTPTTATATPLTTTKSGRQVLKPTSYNPAAMEAASKKRVYYGKRTTEQALCKKCTRMHSPATNQIVFCDGCNEGWHQMCHDPWVDDETVRDAQRAWYCSACHRANSKRGGNSLSAKRQRVTVVEQQTAVVPTKESWAHKTAQQRRVYLNSLSQQELLSLIMTSLEIHPDLPIFPGPPATPNTETTPRSLFAGSMTDGLFSRAEGNPTGQINYIRKLQNGNSKGGGSSSGRGRNGNGNGNGNSIVGKRDGSQEGGGGEEEEEDLDPLAPLWPKAGQGLYRRLGADVEDVMHLVDDNDYEAFSVIVFDERGRKVKENGMAV